MVRRLIRLTVETGCACALSAVLELAFFLGLPDTNIHLIVYVRPPRPFASLYCLSTPGRARAHAPSAGR